MYKIRITPRFKRDVKRCQKQQKPMQKFKAVNELLISGKALPEKHRDHSLTGRWSGFRECHLQPDWLLIYRISQKEKTIAYVRMGSHAELF